MAVPTAPSAPRWDAGTVEILEETALPHREAWLALRTADETVGDPDEVTHAGRALVAVPGTPVRDPAFDVTPAALVSALITGRGAR